MRAVLKVRPLVFFRPIIPPVYIHVDIHARLLGLGNVGSQGQLRAERVRFEIEAHELGQGDGSRGAAGACALLGPAGPGETEGRFRVALMRVALRHFQASLKKVLPPGAWGGTREPRRKRPKSNFSGRPTQASRIGVFPGLFGVPILGVFGSVGHAQTLGLFGPKFAPYAFPHGQGR